MSIHTNIFPLHEAVVIDNFQLVQKLLAEGYCVNTMHFDRVTPLHMACLRGNLEIVTYLTNKGALINAQSIDNATPLCEACAGGNIECVKYLLEAGAWVNPPLLLSTPLHEATLRGKADIASLLLSVGAEVNLSDLHYGTPLHAVCSMANTNVKCIEVLLKGGAHVNAIKNHKTPLHLIAANSQSAEAAKLLISYGANVYLKDGNGHTPRNICRPKSEVAVLLSFYETQPRPLIHWCRVALLHFIGPNKIKSFNRLPIPYLILKYLD